MPKHTFSYSKEFLNQVREAVRNVFDVIEIARFSQEASYSSAILSRLHGIEIQSTIGEYVKIESTVVDDRGPNAAESRYGADFSITATISDGNTTIRKAILFQVKSLEIDKLNLSELERLKNQIRRMKNVVDAPKVAGLREEGVKGMFEISSGNKILNDLEYSKTDFPEYFNQRVITTLDGTTDNIIVDGIQESNLKKLDVVVKAKG